MRSSHTCRASLREWRRRSRSPPRRRTGARGLLVAQSTANTATATFALFALAGLGATHTGVTVALSEADVPPLLSTLAPVAALAAAAGAVLVVVAGDRYLRAVRRVNGAVLAAGVLVGLAVLAGAFAGAVGVVTYVVAGVVGVVPVRLGARRVHLMSVLLGPLALGLWRTVTVKRRGRRSEI